MNGRVPGHDLIGTWKFGPEQPVSARLAGSRGVVIVRADGPDDDATYALLKVPFDQVQMGPTYLEEMRDASHIDQDASHATLKEVTVHLRAVKAARLAA